MSKFNSILGSALVATAVVWFFVGRAGGKQGHLAETPCQDCHVAAQVDQSNATILIASQEKVCVSCHANAVRLSHPSGFSPQRPLPTEFPLDWKGALTCSSCHAIHAQTPGLPRTTLRGAGLCHACHDQAFFAKMADGGVSVAGSGHLDSRAAVSGLSLDAFTLQCLGCHDDQGGDRRVGMNSNGVLSHFGSSVNHPIGVNYDQAARGGGYRPAVQLPPEILLPNGTVGCVSCHEGYSTIHGKLLKPATGTGLCLVCHDL